MQNSPKKIILHHSAISGTGAQLDQINEYHKSKWEMKSSLGFFVGYHYIIEKDGTTIQTRRHEDEGVHCIGQNFESIGICMAGNFDHERPTPAQEQAFARLALNLCEWYGMPYIAIYPHRMFKSTSCNGIQLNNIYGAVLVIKEKIAQLEAQITNLKSI